MPEEESLSIYLPIIPSTVQFVIKGESVIYRINMYSMDIVMGDFESIKGLLRIRILVLWW